MPDEPKFIYVSSKKACAFYGVTANTLRRWADSNRVIYRRNIGNQRVYRIPTGDIRLVERHPTTNDVSDEINYIYCRVSSSKQKDDLERQCVFMDSKYPNYTIIKDIGSGLNFKRKGLLKMLENVIKGRVRSIVVFSKDRLCRFGYDLIEWICLQHNTELLVFKHISLSKEQQFTEDILAILQVFACRWNGSRKYKGNEIKEDQNKEIVLDTETTIDKME